MRECGAAFRAGNGVCSETLYVHVSNASFSLFASGKGICVRVVPLARFFQPVDRGLRPAETGYVYIIHT